MGLSKLLNNSHYWVHLRSHKKKSWNKIFLKKRQKKKKHKKYIIWKDSNVVLSSVETPLNISKRKRVGNAALRSAFESCSMLCSCPSRPGAWSSQHFGCSVTEGERRQSSWDNGIGVFSLGFWLDLIPLIAGSSIGGSHLWFGHRGEGRGECRRKGILGWRI